MKRLQVLLHMPLAVLFGLSMGVLLFLWAPVLVGKITDEFDTLFPVLTMSGQVVQIEPNAVDVHISGTKHRGTECKQVRIYGYSIEPDGTLHAALATRIDLPAQGIVHGAGKIDIGVWRVRPIVQGAIGVRVYTEHICVGRHIKTKVADVRLP